MKIIKLRKMLLLVCLFIFSFGALSITGCQQQSGNSTSVSLSSNVNDIDNFLDAKLYDISNRSEKEISFDSSIEAGTKVKVDFNILPEQYENCIITGVKLNSNYISNGLNECRFYVVQGKNELFIELDVLRLIDIDTNGYHDADVFVCDYDGVEVVKAKPGSQLSVSILDNKKEIEEVKINNITIVEGMDGRYSFMMPDEDVHVSVTWGDTIYLKHWIRINTNGETVTKGNIKVTNQLGEEITTSIAGEMITVIINHSKPVSEVKINGSIVEKSDTNGVFNFVMPDENVFIDISRIESA